MPCTNKKARQLLKSGKASIYNYNPFTIQLNYATGETTQSVDVGVDTGAKHIGLAVTSNNQVLVQGEIELRDDVSKNIQQRAQYRGARRSRKTRYRQARFLNRKRKEGWLPPSVQSKLDTTIMWIDRFCELVPNPKLHIEVGKFDVAKMINPDISGEEYQNGNTKGYFDVRYFVFARDQYTCQVCKKKKDKILNTHHILYKTLGGTDRADNLITVCTDCHTSANHKPGGVLHKWMKANKKVKQYKDPTFMNVVRKRMFEIYPDARFTYGSETTPRRKGMGLDKTHFNDAVVISGIEAIKYQPDSYFQYKQFRKKKRSLHESIPRKGRKTKNISAKRNNKNVKYRNGTYLGDAVIYNGLSCWVYGFASGERSRDCVLRDLDGKMIRAIDRVNSNAVDSKNFRIKNHSNGWLYKKCEQNCLLIKIGGKN